MWIATEEASVCFAHSGTPGDALHVQAGVGNDAAEAFRRSRKPTVPNWLVSMTLPRGIFV